MTPQAGSARPAVLTKGSSSPALRWSRRFAGPGAALISHFYCYRTVAKGGKKKNPNPQNCITHSKRDKNRPRKRIYCVSLAPAVGGRCGHVSRRAGTTLSAAGDGWVGRHQIRSPGGLCTASRRHELSPGEPGDPRGSSCRPRPGSPPPRAAGKGAALPSLRRSNSSPLAAKRHPPPAPHPVVAAALQRLAFITLWTKLVPRCLWRC